MNNISTDELEQKIAAAAEIIDRYFDSTSASMGIPHLTAILRLQNYIPQPMLKGIDEIASELNISRDAVIYNLQNKTR